MFSLTDGTNCDETTNPSGPSLIIYPYQARKLRKYKERRLDGYHGGPNMGENLADVLNSIEVEDDVAVPQEEDAFVDPEQAVITKVKR